MLCLILRSFAIRHICILIRHLRIYINSRFSISHRPGDLRLGCSFRLVYVLCIRIVIRTLQLKRVRSH